MAGSPTAEKVVVRVEHNPEVIWNISRLLRFGNMKCPFLSMAQQQQIILRWSANDKESSQHHDWKAVMDQSSDE
jgi:hypothetical protein